MTEIQIEQTDTDIRPLTMEQIDATSGGSIAIGFAVGAAVAYFGLHTAVEKFLLDRQERYYASR